MSVHNKSQDVFSSVSLLNEKGSYPVLIVCEHASNYIPSQFHNLGLSSTEIKSHIAWDIGAGEIAMHLSRLFDAPFVTGEVSRLVYDCNRPPDAVDAIPEKSEVYEIPGNNNLGKIERQLRVDQVYKPFRNCMRQALTNCSDIEALITIHSFTPVFNGKKRDVQIGILHDEDTRLADVMLDLAKEHTPYITKRNEPYSAQDGVTHTLREHGVSKGLMNVMIEIRNDLIQSSLDCQDMAKMLHGLILDSFAHLNNHPNLKRQA